MAQKVAEYGGYFSKYSKIAQTGRTVPGITQYS